MSIVQKYMHIWTNISIQRYIVVFLFWILLENWNDKERLSRWKLRSSWVRFSKIKSSTQILLPLNLIFLLRIYKYEAQMSVIHPYKTPTWLRICLESDSESVWCSIIDKIIYWTYLIAFRYSIIISVSIFVHVYLGRRDQIVLKTTKTDETYSL